VCALCGLGLLIYWWSSVFSRKRKS